MARLRVVAIGDRIRLKSKVSAASTSSVSSDSSQLNVQNMDKSSSSSSSDISDDVKDIMVKETSAVPECPCLFAPRPTFHLSHMEITKGPRCNQIYDTTEIEKQIIPQKTIMGMFKSKLQNLMGSLQTQYTANEFFQHTFVFKSQQTVQSSFCEIRNGDYLLRINNNDMTLPPHTEVCKLIENLPISEIGNITMDYVRPGMDSIFHANLNLNGPDEAFSVRSEPREQWKPTRTVIIQCRGNLKFMQGTESQQIIFEELVSLQGNRCAHEIHRCHFIEEVTMKQIGNGMIFLRRLKHETSGENLLVTHEGCICLSKNENTVFVMKATKKNAYSVIEEFEKRRYLCVEGRLGQFVDNKYDKDSLSDKFKFEIKNVKCS